MGRERRSVNTNPDSAIIQEARNAAKIPRTQRSDVEIDAILDLVKDSSIFSSLLQVQQRLFCEMMTLESFAPNEVVFNYGDDGDKYYIVLTGRVCVRQPAPDSVCPRSIHLPAECTCAGRATVATHLERPAGFGDTALQSEKLPRNATVLTEEATELLVVTRDEVQTRTDSSQRNFLDERIKFLRKCAGMQQVSLQDITVLASCLQEAEYRSNAVVLRQGGQADQIIFVRRGQMIMLRSIDRDIHLARSLCESDLLSPGHSQQLSTDTEGGQVRDGHAAQSHP